MTAYNSQSRYFIGDLGQSTNLGGSVQLGWPVGRSLYTRLFTSYTLESVRYSGDTTTLLGSVAEYVSWVYSIGGQRVDAA